MAVTKKTIATIKFIDGELMMINSLLTYATMKGKVTPEREKLMKETTTNAIAQINSIMQDLTPELKADANEIKKQLIQVQSKTEALTELKLDAFIARLEAVKKDFEIALAWFKHLNTKISA